MKNILAKMYAKESKVELGSLQSLEADIVEVQFGIKRIKELKKEIKDIYEKTNSKIDTDLSEYDTKAKEVGIEPKQMDAFNKLRDLKSQMDTLINK